MSQSIFTETELSALEASHSDGWTAGEVVACLAAKGERLSEATFRKYVQLGLLPRSKRVGRKGKHRGSLGLYPASVLRQLIQIRDLMGSGLTIEEIQKQACFLQGEVETLSTQLGRVIDAIEGALAAHGTDGRPRQTRLRRKVDGTKKLGDELLSKLREIEFEVLTHSRMSRAVV